MLTFGMIGPVLPKLIASFVGNNYSYAAVVIGLFATVWALMQFVFSPLLGMLSDRVGRRPVILISTAATAVDYAIMALAPNLWWLFAGRVLSGIATANFSTASAYIADVTPPEKRAKAFGVIGSAFGLGFVLDRVHGGLGDRGLEAFEPPGGDAGRGGGLGYPADREALVAWFAGDSERVQPPGRGLGY